MTFIIIIPMVCQLFLIRHAEELKMTMEAKNKLRGSTALPN
jgi:hypothetical protein